MPFQESIKIVWLYFFVLIPDIYKKIQKELLTEKAAMVFQQRNSLFG
jgi:hypothetical protein